MAEEEEEIEVALGPFFKMYADGRIERGGRATVAASAVATRDVSMAMEGGQWARIFLPPPPLQRRVPVVLYFHGGGWMFGSPCWSNFHDFCSEMASRSRSIWVSCSYRLAPDHRLPAAIQDCIYSFHWLPTCQDPWIQTFADLSQIFLCGESAGANLAHHVAINLAHLAHVRGLILVHPAFLRGTPTTQELACPQDELMNWDMASHCLRFVLPIHASISTPLLNPLLSFPPDLSSSSTFHYADSTLVILADHDPLHILGLEYADALSRRGGRRVETFMSHGVGHVFFIAEPKSEQAEALFDKIADFIGRHTVQS